MAVGDSHLQLETFVVIRSFFVEQYVRRRSVKLLLGILLEQRLVVLTVLVGLHHLDVLGEVFEHEA